MGMRIYGTITHNVKTAVWHIECEPHVMLRLKRMFPSITNTYDGRCILSDNPSNCRDMLWFIERYPLVVDELDRLRRSAESHETMLARLDEISNLSYTPKDVPLAIELWEFQRRAVEIMGHKKSLLLTDDVGLGKTASSIGVFVNPEARPALVVTLTHLPHQWRNEIKDFAPDLKVFIPDRARPNINTTGPRHLWEGDGPLSDKPDVIILNYHKLAGWAEYIVGYIKTVIWDEVQELRRNKSAKYDAAQIISASCEYRMGLSATPIYNYAGEIFNIMQNIDPGSLGSHEEFLNEWGGYHDGRGRVQVKKVVALGSYMREHHLMLGRTRKEVGREIPPVSSIQHVIEYDVEELHKIKAKAVNLAKVLLGQAEATRTEKFHAGGQFDMLMRQATGIAKAPYVAEFVKMLMEAEEKIVLYGWHREVYSIWMEQLKEYSPAMYTGTESPKKKRESFERFSNGDTNILIMSLRAGAGLDGLQYTGCRTVVFGEIDWSPGIHYQCIGRIWREGQEEPVVAYYLVTEDGSDPIIIDTLGIKRAQSEGIKRSDGKTIELILDDPKKKLRDLAEAYLKSIGQAGKIK